MDEEQKKRNDFGYTFEAWMYETRLNREWVGSQKSAAWEVFRWLWPMVCKLKDELKAEKEKNGFVSDKLNALHADVRDLKSLKVHDYWSKMVGDGE
jgi:hypothetical protein